MGVKNMIRVQRYQSPCGDLLLGSFGDALCLCDWAKERPREQVGKRLCKYLQADYEESASDVVEEAARQLDAYFGGKRKKFDIPLLFVGTDFQKTVWDNLLGIAYGETVSYAGLARKMDAPHAVRAVANANGANAISLFVPCHRVVGSDGSLTGYAGGLIAKRMLLDMEAGGVKKLF